MWKLSVSSFWGHKQLQLWARLWLAWRSVSHVFVELYLHNAGLQLLTESRLQTWYRCKPMACNNCTLKAGALSRSITCHEAYEAGIVGRRMSETRANSSSRKCNCSINAINWRWSDHFLAGSYFSACNCLQLLKLPYRWPWHVLTAVLYSIILRKLSLSQREWTIDRRDSLWQLNCSGGWQYLGWGSSWDGFSLSEARQLRDQAKHVSHVVVRLWTRIRAGFKLHYRLMIICVFYCDVNSSRI